jgi:CBS domain-containing protein
LADSSRNDRLVEVMTGNVIRIRSDESLYEAQKLLIESKLTRLVVIDRSGRLEGVITRRDLVRFLTQDKSRRPLDQMRVREAMSKPVVTLRPTDTLIEAARVMNRKGVSSIVVTDEGKKALGIVTKTDLCFHFSLSPSKEKVEDYMTRKVFTVRPTHSIFFASSVLARQGISRVLVDDGKLRGIVTLSDIVRSAPVMRPEKRKTLLPAPAKLTAMTASDVMTPNPLTVALDDALSRAAELMIEHGISGLPVVDSKNRVRGIVTKTDIVRAIAA